MQGSPLRLLWVKVGGMWPLDTGGRLRTFNLVSELSRRHHVTVLTTHAPGAADAAAALAAQLPRAEVHSLPYEIPKRGSVRFAVSLARSWVGRLPVDVTKFHVPSLHDEVRRRLRGGAVDVCVADFLSSTSNVPLDGPTPVVFFAHNVEHMIWRRLADVERGRLRHALLALEARKVQRWEAEVCARARATVAVSEVDAERLAALAPGARVGVVPTGVDTEYYHPNGDRPIAGRLAFIGSMDWHPNEDGVLYFLEAIWPRIRRERPDVSFAIVGRHPRPRLRAAAEAAGAIVTGTVDDVRPWFAQAEVCVVPLRVGGGTRLKIFEALGMAAPLVSTSVGAEGLPIVPGEHYLRADPPEAFAAAVLELLRDRARARALGDAGRRLVAARYSWAQVTREFETICHGTLEGLCV